MKKFMGSRLFYILALALLAGGSAQARLVDRTAAAVNADVITLSDIQAFPRTSGPRRDLDIFFNFFQMNPQSEADIMDYLIQERLVLQKFAITKDEVESEINNIQTQNKIDRDRLKLMLASQGLDYDEYERFMKVALAKRKLIGELRALAIVTDEEVRNHYYTSSEFADRSKNQRLLLSYTLEQMSLPSEDLAKEVSRRLRAGEDFDSLAAEFANRGVDRSSLGTFQETRLSGPVREALAGLKSGASTKPIYTGSGYQILKISEIGAPKDEGFERLKEQIRNQLFRKSMLAQLKLWTEKERSVSYIYLPE